MSGVAKCYMSADPGPYIKLATAVLVGAEFDKSAKFKDLGKRMKKFLKLTVTGTNRTTKWIPKV